MLAYACTSDGDSHPVIQDIETSQVRNGFGGKPRTFFICPLCGRRARKLYMRWGLFRCRECARLNYPSQQVTKGTDQCASRMRSILREDFDVVGSFAPVDMGHMTPEKPKWMRWETYYRKLIKLRKAQLAYSDAFIAGALRILGPGWRP